MKDYIIDEVEGLYKIIKLKEFRKTEGVNFDVMVESMVPKIDAVDRVLHKAGAISPGSVGDIERPWYMHKSQDDNLIVLQGTRYVEIYTQAHGKVEKFTVEPNKITHNGKVVFEGGAVLVWPVGVFHRILSGDEGSASINLATHYDGFDIKNNFNVYDLNPETGEYKVIREGFKDQK
ncbi:hypothetical protein SAMN02745245_00144 [Anaerosphaera aminiphila DSM 21120]|uniref:Cupin type-1 domain-containing protein n=1 Tax=Anaerosphaera aminiphila DSM 21120 TaxID=1120995 RepID=A0A1M5P1F5_9FIRM|nr:hypothetical protein [Anaerosphaera aminiphila]SHG95646.1 hypothetical protein SAMN02745245_00144 [Anaerosphaera aminiphila DSM 21120]